MYIKKCFKDKNNYPNINIYNVYNNVELILTLHLC